MRSLWCSGSMYEMTLHTGAKRRGTLMISIFCTIGGKRPAHASSTGVMYWPMMLRARLRAGPCRGKVSSQSSRAAVKKKSSSDDTALVGGLIACGVVAALGLLFICFMASKEKAGEPVFAPVSTKNPVVAEEKDNKV